MDADSAGTNPVAQEAVSLLYRNMQRVVSERDTTVTTQCDVRNVDTKSIRVGKVSLTDCKGIVIEACNKSQAQVLTCESGVLVKIVIDTVTEVINNHPDLEPNIFDYMFDAFPQQTPDVTITNLLKEYVTRTCNQFNVTNQEISLRSINGLRCNNDLVQLINQSDINIKCAVTSITELFNGAMAAPSVAPGPDAPKPKPTFPKVSKSDYTLSPKAVPIVAALASLGFVFAVVLVGGYALLRTSKKPIVAKA